MDELMDELTDFQTENKLLFDALLARGVMFVVCEYSGGGDSGQIDLVRAFDSDRYEEDDEGIDIKSLTTADSPNSEIVLAATAALLNETTESMHAQLEQLCYDSLETLNVQDWVNNDGGQGRMTIDVAAGTASIEHEWNVSVAHSSEYEL